jgi:hypothetical protein
MLYTLAFSAFLLGWGRKQGELQDWVTLESQHVNAAVQRSNRKTFRSSMIHCSVVNLERKQTLSKPEVGPQKEKLCRDPQEAISVKHQLLFVYS